MRADARRNRDRIVTAARELFADHGTDAPLDDVAKRAGVGPATLYRHFPTRAGLVDAVVGDHLVDLAADDPEIEGGEDRDTARRLLLASLTSAVNGVRAHHGLATKLLAALDDPASALHGRGLELARTNQAVVDRLLADGALRDGVGSSHVSLLVCGLAAAADHGALDNGTVESLAEIVTEGLLRPCRARHPGTPT